MFEEDALIALAMRSLTTSLSFAIFIAEVSNAVRLEGRSCTSDSSVLEGVTFSASPTLGVARSSSSFDFNQNIRTLQESVECVCYFTFFR